MQRKKITNADVERFPSSAEDKAKPAPVLWDGELKGFGVRYFPATQTRTYFLQFRVKGGKEKHIKIGRHNDPYRVDQARAKAMELKAAMLSGIDPIEQQREQQEAKKIQAKLDDAYSVTLRTVLNQYLEHKRTKHGPLREATKQSMRKTVERYLPTWLDKPMAATVTREACFSRFVEISDHEESRLGGTGKKGAANLTFVYLRALCNYARAMYEDDDGEPTIFAINPVTRMQRVRKPNRLKPRTRRIPLSRVGRVWLALRRRAATARSTHDRTAADWVSALLLTGWRATECGSLLWSQCDMHGKTIRLLGSVVKNHNELTLPMSDALHGILDARKKQIEHLKAPDRHAVYVFASGRTKMPYLRDARSVMQTIAEIADCFSVDDDGNKILELSPHDLRRTAEDIAKACRIDPDERRQLLNHLASDIHGQAYSNNPDPEVLRPAVNAIAKYVLDAARVAEEQERGANVIPFNKATA